MKTNHLADWRRARWRDVMWFRLTHTRYGCARDLAQSTKRRSQLRRDESKVHERDEIYSSFLYVCGLSITMATTSSFSLFRSLQVPVLMCCVASSRFSKCVHRKHRLPQHQHWAWKHRHTCRRTFEHSTTCLHAQKFLATSCSRIFSLESFILRFAWLIFFLDAKTGFSTLW